MTKTESQTVVNYLLTSAGFLTFVVCMFYYWQHFYKF